MLNLTLEQVKAYAKEYKAVPVAKECLADMLTPLAFLDNVRRSSRTYFLLESIEGSEHWARYSSPSWRRRVEQFWRISWVYKACYSVKYAGNWAS